MFVFLAVVRVSADRTNVSMGRHLIIVTTGDTADMLYDAGYEVQSISAGFRQDWFANRAKQVIVPQSLCSLGVSWFFCFDQLQISLCFTFWVYNFLIISNAVSCKEQCNVILIRGKKERVLRQLFEFG